MKRSKIWLTISILALIGCLAALGYAIHYRTNQKQGQSAYEDIRETADKEDENKADTKPEENVGNLGLSVTPKEGAAAKKGVTPSPTKKTEPTITPVEIPIDFKSLKEKNEEIYAWITIPGTNIDYPVLQSSTDDSFYIHRGIDGEYLYAGAIYTELKNSKDFTDFNTVLYGHNMKDGSMFAGLHAYQDRDFFDKNKEIIIYTPEHIYHYEIFAAYTYDDRHILNSFDFRNKEVVQAYLDEVFAIRVMDAYFRDETKVTAEDHVITLSTCIANAPSSRYLVQGVLKEAE